jgi:hypothetical protein
VTAAPGAYSLRDFEGDFPDEARCLDWLIAQIFPEGIPCRRCGRITPHHPLKKRRAYSCAYCGSHVHPASFTRIHGSPTPLKKWFLATFLLSRSRGRISNAQLGRELGVTYKTAWRIATTIRSAVAKSAHDELEESGRSRTRTQFLAQVWTREHFFDDLNRIVDRPKRRRDDLRDTGIDDALARRVKPRREPAGRRKR